MFNPILKKYLVVFVVTFTGYSFINWFTSFYFDLPVPKNYVDFWIPAAICYLLSFLVFRPAFKKRGYTEKAASFLLWGLIPFSIWIPIAFSQPFFKDISYRVISIERLQDLDRYPHEKFFKISRFVVDTTKRFLIKEQHSSGKYGATLHLNNYFVVPMFDDSLQQQQQLSKVVYGIRFHRTLNNGMLFNDGQQQKIDAFTAKSKADFSKYNFYKVSYFERLKHTDDATYLTEAADRSAGFDKKSAHIILMKHSGTIDALYQEEAAFFLYSTLISLAIGLISLFIVDRYQLKHRQPA